MTIVTDVWKICLRGTDSSRDEGISIPRPNQPLRYNHDSALAKSLPMRVPALSNYQTQEIEIEDRVWSHHY